MDAKLDVSTVSLQKIHAIFEIESGHAREDRMWFKC